MGIGGMGLNPTTYRITSNKSKPQTRLKRAQREDCGLAEKQRATSSLFGTALGFRERECAAGLSTTTCFARIQRVASIHSTWCEFAAKCRLDQA